MKNFLLFMICGLLMSCSSVLLDPCSSAVSRKPPCYDMSWPVKFGRIKPNCYCVCPHPRISYKT